MIFSNKIDFCWFPSPPYLPSPCPDTRPQSVASLFWYDWVCPIALPNLQTHAPPLLMVCFLGPIHKQASEMHRQFSKEEMQLNNKHFEKCSVSQATRKNKCKQL